MYHMIACPHSGAKFNGLRVSPEKFERQITWLKHNHWHFTTMAELMSHSESLPNKTVAITFDDGYQDNYTDAFRIMKKYGVKGTLYLVVNRHDNDWSTQKKAHHDSGELARTAKLSDEQVQEMVDSGLFEIGGHTLSHVNLSTSDEETKRKEIADCKVQLETTFNTSVTSFAYPFGIYQDDDPELVASLGFTNAVLAEGGIETDRVQRRFTLRRIKISGKDNFFAFKCRIKTGKRGLKK